MPEKVYTNTSGQSFDSLGLHTYISVSEGRYDKWNPPDYRHENQSVPFPGKGRMAEKLSTEVSFHETCTPKYISNISKRQLLFRLWKFLQFLQFSVIVKQKISCIWGSPSRLGCGERKIYTAYDCKISGWYVYSHHTWIYVHITRLPSGFFDVIGAQCQYPF